MPYRRVAVLVGIFIGAMPLAACSILFQESESGDAGTTQIDADNGDGGPADAMSQDAGPPAPGRYSNCVLPTAVNINLTGGQWELDTSNDDTSFTQAGPGGGSIVAAKGGDCNGAFVLHVGSFVLAATAEVRVTGSRPLMIVSDTTIEIAGVLDLSSRLDSLGAGAESSTAATCDSAAADEVGLSGGGAGGSFQGVGGAGGTALTMAGSAAHVATAVLPSALTAGCPGINGSGPTLQGGRGGPGGGAVHLEASQSILVSGDISASGGGGEGGAIDFGGGGGGASGGFIGFRAPTVTFSDTANIIATGGGGGSDANAAKGITGTNGYLDTARSLGGILVSGNGGGGDGSGDPLGGDPTGGREGEPAIDLTTGGGGGGGGAGFIAVFTNSLSATAGATVFPPVTQQPFN